MFLYIMIEYDLFGKRLLGAEVGPFHNDSERSQWEKSFLELIEINGRLGAISSEPKGVAPSKRFTGKHTPMEVYRDLYSNEKVKSSCVSAIVPLTS